jgi:hypothetical protein
MQTEIAALEQSSAEDQHGVIALAEAETAMSDGMNTYLNALGPDRWPEGPASCELRNRTLALRVASESWSGKLGATLKAYFVVSYQYALLNLTARSGFAYPGLVILDFPPNLASSRLPVGSENYLVEPFQKLLVHAPGLQVIAAGDDLNLPNANRIVLDKVWR